MNTDRVEGKVESRKQTRRETTDYGTTGPRDFQGPKTENRKRVARIISSNTESEGMACAGAWAPGKSLMKASG